MIVMRMMSVTRRFAGAIGILAMATLSAYAQSEIDPDHFDSPNTEPILQPTVDTQNGVIRYDGEFTLVHEVWCNGISLRPGKYSVSLRSNGKVGQVTLNQKRHTTKIAAIVQTQAAKQRNEAIVENNGKGRTLCLIRVSKFDFVFDPKHSVDPSSGSKAARVEEVLLRVIVSNEIANQVPSQASPKR